MAPGNSALHRRGTASMIAPLLSLRAFSTAVHSPELDMVEPRATARALVPRAAADFVRRAHRHDGGQSLVRACMQIVACAPSCGMHAMPARGCEVHATMCVHARV